MHFARELERSSRAVSSRGRSAVDQFRRRHVQRARWASDDDRGSHSPPFPAAYFVLATGGYNPHFGVLKTAELYNPKTHTWAATGSMEYPRAMHTMNVSAESLAAGFVLPGTSRAFVAGGFDETMQPGSTAKVFNLGTGAWTEVAPMNVPRMGHASVGVRAGLSVFVAGGYGPSGAVHSTSETYDPVNNVWKISTTNMMEPRAELTLTGFKAQTLVNGDTIPGRIVAAGGKPNRNGTTLEQYEIGATGAGVWRARVTKPIAFPVYGHTAVPAVDGTQIVLIAGGMNGLGQTVPHVQKYDKDTLANAGASAALMNDRQYHVAVTLPDSKVLFATGRSELLGASKSVAVSEIYDVATGVSTLLSPSNGWDVSGRIHAGMAWIPGDKYLLAGGSGVTGTLADSYEFTP